MMHWGNFSGMGYGGFGWIFMALFWVVVMLGVAYLIKQLPGSGRSSAHKETAVEILKRKYASGEITKDEYNEKMSVIGKQ